jgi:hypothetical protein
MDRIFSLWPNLAELAKDIGAPYPTVAAWKQRGSIPGTYDIDLIEAARGRGKTLTLDDLAQARRGRRATPETQQGAA